MEKSLQEMLHGPDKLQSIFIHRKNKDYVITKVLRDSPDGEIRYECYASHDGFNERPITSGPALQNLLPEPAQNNIYQASVNLSKYLRKNGFKEVNTIIQTKDGTKLR